MEILSIIPARSGSKGVAHKNIREVAGKPLLAYPIEHALGSKLITRVIVSTDSEEYMEIARRYGAETPFKRPLEFAEDDSLDIDVFYHALTWLRDNEGYMPDICVQLRPCGPVRDILLIDRIIQRLIDNPQWDSVRTVSRGSENPYKMWHFSDDGTLSPLMRDIPECYNMLRQQLPATFYQNGYVDAFRPRAVLEQRSMTGKTIGGFLVDEYFDIDYPEDIALVEACLAIRTSERSFLIDTELKNHEIVNKLRRAGHTVYIGGAGAGRATQTGGAGAGRATQTGGAGAGQATQADYHISAKSIGIRELERILSNEHDG